MSNTKMATKDDLQEMYQRILPYLGGMPEMLANKFSKGDLYSTDEKMIGQWIDGKPLYQRTVIAAISGGTTEGQLYYKQIDVSSLSIDSFISCNACLKGSNICITLPSFEYVSSFGRCYFIFAGSSTTLQININEANATVLNRIKESSAYVTLQYTKTTDSAIAIGSDTDYSTTEKIVGTWIDGKPIWQKTLQLRPTKNYPANTVTYDTLYTDESVDKLISINGTLTFTYGNYSTRTLPWSTTISQEYNFIPRWDQNQNTLLMEIGLKGGSAYQPSEVLFVITLQYTKTTS